MLPRPHRETVEYLQNYTSEDFILRYSSLGFGHHWQVFIAVGEVASWTCCSTFGEGTPNILLVNGFWDLDSAIAYLQLRMVCYLEGKLQMGCPPMHLLPLSFLVVEIIWETLSGHSGGVIAIHFVDDKTTATVCQCGENYCLRC